ncbi:MAG: FxsA family protein [Planctomycetes bacterium]|nr:FxsA family protein [Planctomycetota bacterium]
MGKLLYILAGLLFLPFLELVLLTKVGGRLGLPGLAAWLVGTLLAGIGLWRTSPPFSARRVAAVLLAVPGLATDVLALLVLLPLTRRAILSWLLAPGSRDVWAGGGVSFGGKTYDMGPEDTKGDRGPRSPPGVPGELGGGPVRDAAFRVLPPSTRAEGRYEES